MIDAVRVPKTHHVSDLLTTDEHHVGSPETRLRLPRFSSSGAKELEMESSVPGRETDRGAYTLQVVRAVYTSLYINKYMIYLFYILHIYNFPHNRHISRL